MYLNQVVRIKWDHYISPSFRVSNGVKQDGVLSPVFFTIYIDELLERLNKPGLGCYRSCICWEPLDMQTNIAPTRLSMARLLCMALNFSAEYKLIFNSSKSKLIIFCKNGVIDGSVPFWGYCDTCIFSAIWALLRESARTLSDKRAYAPV